MFNSPVDYSDLTWWCGFGSKRFMHPDILSWGRLQGDHNDFGRISIALAPSYN
jgi:hypothetical protein